MQRLLALSVGSDGRSSARGVAFARYLSYKGDPSFWNRQTVIHYPHVKERCTMANYDEELDASGLNCPLPILRAKKALNTLDSGKILRIIATDPGSVKDFEAFSKQTGNELLESKEVSGKYEFLIKKA
jgi:tRNA 2-thiouridine synthesizing protein A